MKIVHFDVDAELNKYLEGEKYPYTLQDIPDIQQFRAVEAISVKTGSRVTKANLSGFPDLKLLITRTVGVDHIDLEYCKEKGIAVYHVVDYGSFNIAEHAFALLLNGSRNILDSQKDIKAGIFSYKSHLGIALKGKRIGIVGTGKIGLEMIKRAKGFEMDVVAYDVFKNEKASKEMGFEYVELAELARSSDVISLHAPLLESTKHIINEDIINQMKKGVLFINTARGGLVDTEALIKHVDTFRFIGLDVLEGEESFSKDHPFLKYSHVVITPHMAFYSDASVQKIAEETVKLLSSFEKGDTEGRVV
jgi:lactate dehydrogenase-like 2-hydroxyacid dehydrogenase